MFFLKLKLCKQVGYKKKLQKRNRAKGFISMSKHLPTVDIDSLQKFSEGINHLKDKTTNKPRRGILYNS